MLLPTAFALLTLLTSRDLGLPGGAVAIVAVGFAIIWVPTSVWLAWARFWRPRADERALILTTGELLDRAAFLHVVRAQATEVCIMTVGMLAMGAAFPWRFGWWGAPALVMTLIAAGWVGTVLWARAWFATAVVRIAEDDAVGAMAAAQRARILKILRRTRDALLLIHAQAHLRLGAPDQSLLTLKNIRRKRAIQVDYLLAMLQLGRGVSPPQALLDESPESLPRQFVQTQLRAMVALVDEEPERALSELATWDPARDWLPLRQRHSLDLLAAAAHQQAGRHERAHRQLHALDLAPDHVAAINAAYPFWGAQLLAITPSAE